MGVVAIFTAGDSAVHAQTAVLVGLDELNNIIDRLHGRVLTQRIRVRQQPALSSDHQRGEGALKNMQTALTRMRALRAAMVVDQPTGYLH
jgi:hypothetical protein